MSIDDLYRKALKQAAARNGNGGEKAPPVPGRGRFYLALQLGERVRAEKYEDESIDPDKGLGQLAKGYLDGVTGISSCKEIVTAWYGRGDRYALLVMDQHAIRTLNNLTEIQYANPEYLLSNNMAVLLRLYQKTRSLDGYEQIFMRFMNSIGDAIKIDAEVGKEVAGEHVRPSEVPQIPAHLGRIWTNNFGSNKDGQRFAAYAISKPIRGSKDILRYFKYWFAEKKKDYYERSAIENWGYQKISDATWIRIIKRAAADMASSYIEECEWIVKAGRLKIPQGSFLYLMHFLSAAEFEQFKTGTLAPPDKESSEGTYYRVTKKIWNAWTKYASDLERRYRVFWVPSHKFERAKEKRLMFQLRESATRRRKSAGLSYSWET